VLELGGRAGDRLFHHLGNIGNRPGRPRALVHMAPALAAGPVLKHARVVRILGDRFGVVRGEPRERRAVAVGHVAGVIVSVIPGRGAGVHTCNRMDLGGVIGIRSGAGLGGHVAFGVVGQIGVRGAAQLNTRKRFASASKYVAASKSIPTQTIGSAALA
jgi:hypothetical protein